MADSISLPARAARARHACMLAYTFYESDGRVLRYAQALVREGWRVDAIVLRRPGQPAEEMIDGVRVLRVQSRQKNERHKVAYLLRVLAFFFRSMAALARCQWASRYDLVHVHSVPDFEVFAAWVPKLMGARVMLDIHDIVPEFYAAKFKVGTDSAVFRALRWIERLSIGFADHVIIANDLWLERIAVRSGPRAKCSALINYPDAEIFHPGLRRRAEGGEFVLLYPGTLSWHQGLDLALHALAELRERAPAMVLHLYGEGPAKTALQALTTQLGLDDRVRFAPPLPLRQIAAVMADADLGVVPKRNDAFGGDAFSTKTLEFMALGVPLVIAETRVDRHYFDAGLVRFFEPGNAQDLARVLLDAYTDRERSETLAARALAFAQAHSWGEKKAEYLDVVERLVDG